MSSGSDPGSAPSSFADRRAGLLALPGRGPGARRALADLTDEWLGEVFAASGAGDVGATLVAVGGLGRRSLSPGSDLDLLLLHPEWVNVDAEAEALWYPIWDSGLALDHSVRHRGQAREMAAEDSRVLIGLLDARTVAGDPAATTALRAEVLSDFRRQGAKRVSTLLEEVVQRRERYSDLAHQLEPDLKNAYGGLRETTVLRALAAASLTEVNRQWLSDVEDALLDVRDAVHRASGPAGSQGGRPRTRGAGDRLVMEQQSTVAEDLGFLGDDGTGDPDSLLRHVLGLGRSIAYRSDQTWRRVAGVTPGASALRSASASRRPDEPAPPNGTESAHQRAVPEPRAATMPLTQPRGAARAVRVPLADGVVGYGDEIRLARNARLRDPVLPLRVASASARTGRIVPDATWQLLARGAEPLPEPWPESARRAFTALLGSGPGLLPVWEGLDQAGLAVRWLPEWGAVRSAPQWNPVHRFTVDRHLVQTAVNAAGLTSSVRRPDLLLVASLLHDIGKARGGDHSKIGARLVQDIAPRLGFDGADCQTLSWLVRHHLLLADVAVRWDLNDPATVAHVSDQIRTSERLDLLHALTIADARATGPAAWTDWKRTLVTDLVTRVRPLVTADSGTPGPTGSEVGPPRLGGDRPGSSPRTRGIRVPADGLPPQGAAAEVTLVDRSSSGAVATVDVQAPDAVGVLAQVAGVLAMHRLEVLAADTVTADGWAHLRWRVEPLFGDLPSADLIRQDVRRALTGDLDPGEVLARRGEAERVGPLAMRQGAAARRARSDASDGSARVRAEFLDGASERASVLEVHAPDRPGLLHALAWAISRSGAVIEAARVDTLAVDAVDVFYLTGSSGGPLLPGEQERVRAEVLAAATIGAQLG